MACPTATSSLVLVWVPITDGWSVFSGMLYAVNSFYGFEWKPFLPQEF